MTEPVPGSLSDDVFIAKYESALGRPFDDDQRNAILAEESPLQLLAGPGSGKSEVIVARAIRCVLVRGAEPKSVLVTTFTDKAARNLQDRIADRLTAMGYSTSLDDLRIGTLHSLCEEIMHQYRFPTVADRRLLNEHEQAFFVYSRTDAVDQKDREFWRNLHYLQGNTPWSGEHGPNKWQRTQALVTLFNRIAEEEVPVDTLLGSADPIRQMIGGMVKEYREKLAQHNRTDFAMIQLQFQDFLSSNYGARFLLGDEERGLPGLRHVLVDEYQDTNPAQETIYLQMAHAIKGAITIVGDDDQSLYRFRGGTVECLVRFASECSARSGYAVDQIQLRTNYRSLYSIVGWNTRMLKAQPVMNQPGVRAPKADVAAHRPDVQGHHPICMVTANRAPDVASTVAKVIRKLIDEKLVDNPAHVAILMKSTKDSPLNAEYLMAAMREEQVPFYNARSKGLLKISETQAIIGGLLETLDPNAVVQNETQQGRIVASLNTWRAQFNALTATNPELKHFIDNMPGEVAKRLAKHLANEQRRVEKGGPHKKPYIDVTIRDIFFRFMKFEPFRSWHAAEGQTQRLGLLSELLEAYSSVQPGGDPLMLSLTEHGRFESTWLRNVIYPQLFGFLHNAELNEPEDLDYEVPPNKVQLMTVHQAKGLEFPVVFVGSLLTKQAGDNAAYQLEDLLVPLSLHPRNLRPADQRAIEDTVRFFYVAGTRAMNLLVFFGRNTHFSDADIPMARPLEDN